MEATGARGVCEALTDDLLDLGVTLPSVYLLVGGRLRCQAARGYFQVVDGFPPGTGVIGRTVVSGTAQVVDTTVDGAFIGAIPGILGEVCVPIMIGGRAIGAVNAESLTSTPPAEWVPLLSAAADLLATRLSDAGALPTDSLIQRVARHAVELGELSDLSAIERWSVGAATRLAGMSTAAIARTGAGGELSVSTSIGRLAERIRAWTPGDLRLIASWLRAGTSAYIPRVDTGPAHTFIAQADVRSLFAHPLTARGASVGLLIVADSEPLGHDPQVVEALELLAALAAGALMTAMTMESLRRQATCDPLTGLSNARAFDAALAAMVGAAPRDRSVACLLIDLDHFKHINDTRGHLAGDDTLRALGAALAGVLRGSDEVFRIGGDEFAVLGLVRDVADADAMAGRLLAAARTVGMSVSIGYALARDGSTESLRARADAALYRAKAAGRDTARGAVR